MTARITSTRSLLALMARIFTPTPPRSRRVIRASSHHVKPSEIQRAWGMPGARCARSLACKIKKHTSKSPRSRRSHPAFPAQWFYGLYRALPGDRALLSPSPAKITSRRLDASVEASEPHDFAVREKYASSSALSRPPHPVPNVRDDRERPSWWDRTARIYC